MASDGGRYCAAILQEFLTARGLRRLDGKLVKLNGTRLSESNREMIARWAELDTVELAKVDPFLLRYDLSTWDLEQWAEQHHGWAGYNEPTVLT